MNRRSVLRGTLLGAAGVTVGLAAAGPLNHLLGRDRPPILGGYAAAADDLSAVARSTVDVHYFAETTQPLVAFTFDDGPGPRWTPMVLDLLEEHRVPATFFMVGRNLTRHPEIVRGRLGRHEVGNHSWAHDDLATMDLGEICRDLTRTHEAIRQHTGREARLLRPPYGHLGGSTLLAANKLGYEVALWSLAMREKKFRDDPAGQADDIVRSVRPGSIVLAHDEGDERRLVTIRGLAAMFDGLRRRGFRFVTVSELLAQSSAPPVPQRSPASGTQVNAQR